MQEMEELMRKKDFHEDQLAQAVMERLSDPSSDCSKLREHWAYGVLLERQLVSQEIDALCKDTLEDRGCDYNKFRNSHLNVMLLECSIPGTSYGFPSSPDCQK